MGQKNFSSDEVCIYHICSPY